MMKSDLPLLIMCLIAAFKLPEGLEVPSKYMTKYRMVRETRNRQTCRMLGSRKHTFCWYEVYYVNVRRSFRTCKVGYASSQCNIPQCHPGCRNKGVCVAVNKCGCPNPSGIYCHTEKCSRNIDCYPGICNKASMKCSCSSEFDGPNCQNMKEGPIFQSCAASLTNKRNGQNEVFHIKFSFYDDELKIYTSMRNFSQLELQWSPTYRKLEDLPPFPSEGYLRAFRVGIINTSAEVVLHNAEGRVATIKPISCVSSASYKSPQETIQCSKVLPFTQGVEHNQTLTFIMRGKTGGFKDIRNQDTAGTYENREMFGQESLRKAYVIFDLEAPFHCTEGITGYLCEHENTKPVEFDLDITSNPDISVAFPGWFDADSGIRGFTYDVYLLEVNSNGRLQNVSTPVLSKICISNFTLPNPGMYAVVAGVHDLANNTKYTRGLILYSNPNDKIEKTDIPLAVYPGPGNNTVDGAFWISDLSSPVTLQWGKHFTNKFIANNNYGSPVAPLPHQFLESNGNVSSKGVTNINGITKFSFSVIDELQLPLTLPQTWTPLTPLEEKLTLSALTSRDTGNNYTIHMKVEDLAGNVFTDHIYIRVDNTPPNVKNISANFTKSVKKEERGFYSSVDISASDFDGGLHFIGFTLYDILNPRDPKQIITGTQPIKKTNQNPDVCQSEGKCVCTTEKECYDNPLKLYLNNCWFVEYVDVPIRIDISVNNKAQLPSNITYQFDKVRGISGVGEYPAPFGLRLKNAYGYVVILTWYLPATCYKIRMINLELTGAHTKSAILSANEKTAEIKEMVPYADYTARLSITYQGNRNSEAVEFKFNTGKPPTD